LIFAILVLRPTPAIAVPSRYLPPNLLPIVSLIPFHSSLLNNPNAGFPASSIESPKDLTQAVAIKPSTNKGRHFFRVLSVNPAAAVLQDPCFSDDDDDDDDAVVVVLECQANAGMTVARNTFRVNLVTAAVFRATSSSKA